MIDLPSSYNFFHLNCISLATVEPREMTLDFNLLSEFIVISPDTTVVPSYYTVKASDVITGELSVFIMPFPIKKVLFSDPVALPPLL